MQQKILIVSSLQSQLSNGERIFQNCGIDDEEEEEEVQYFCRIASVHLKIVSMTIFELDFVYLIKRHNLYAISEKNKKKKSNSSKCMLLSTITIKIRVTFLNKYFDIVLHHAFFYNHTYSIVFNCITSISIKLDQRTLCCCYYQRFCDENTNVTFVL